MTDAGRRAGDGPALRVDLHTHSNASDGVLAPADLVQRAAEAGVDLLALTDHDTVAGIDEAQRAADRYPLRLVPGVEISASWRAQEIHVLGLWIDPASAPLRDGLRGQVERRELRMRRICARLGKLGLPAEALLAAVLESAGVPTRAHLASALVAAGHVAGVDEAFRRYLSTGKPAYVAAGWPPLADAVRWIREAGGVASLAHPARYRLSAGGRRALLAEFVAAGGGALEVVSGPNGAQHVEGCAALAVRSGLAASVGSDFHDPKLAWNPLGRTLALPDCVVPVWRGRGLDIDNEKQHLT